MQTLKAMSIAGVATISLMSAASFAQTISATSLTLDRAEAKISAQAQRTALQNH